MAQTPTRDQIARNILAHGRFIIGTFTGTPFTYSIGNSLQHMPELIIFEIYPPHAGKLINQWSRLMIERGREFSDQELIDIGAEYPCLAVHCFPKVKATHMIQTGQYFGHEDYRVTQIVPPDLRGRFPGDPDCDEPYRSMPILGRRPT